MIDKISFFTKVDFKNGEYAEKVKELIFLYGRKHAFNRFEELIKCVEEETNVKRKMMFPIKIYGVSEENLRIVDEGNKEFILELSEREMALYYVDKNGAVTQKVSF